MNELSNQDRSRYGINNGICLGSVGALAAERYKLKITQPLLKLVIEPPVITSPTALMK